MPNPPEDVPGPTPARRSAPTAWRQRGRLIRPAGYWWAAVAIALGVAAAIIWPFPPAVAGTQYSSHLPLIIAPPKPLFLPFVSKDWPPPPVDLFVNRVELIQGITMSDGYTVHVASRPALLRAFVGLSGQPSQLGVTGRLTRHVGGVPYDSIDAGPITALPSPDEGALSQTLNFSLPAHWLTAGTSYVLQLDPNNAINELSDANNRYPPSGQQAFDFAVAPALDVVIVPVRYARPGAPVSLPNTSDLSYLTWMPFKVYPVPAINYTVRGTALNFTGDLRTTQGWIDLLNAVTTIHAVEDLVEHKTYYALVDSVAVDGCSGGCIAGIGWVNNPPPGGYGSKSAAGFAGFPSAPGEASPTFTHEMAHNFGRRHAPCGTSSGLGPYPYGSGAPIGQWGYDPATSALYHPSNFRDYMSYCSPEWTSDFTYRALYDAWAWVSTPYGSAGSATALQQALMVKGQVDETGRVVIEATEISTVPSALLQSDGPYQVELLDRTGRVLHTQSFDVVEIAIDFAGPEGEGGHGEQRVAFRVALPILQAAAALRLTGPTGSAIEQDLPPETHTP